MALSGLFSWSVVVMAVIAEAEGVAMWCDVNLFVMPPSSFG